jgi:hypothetical protein
MDLTWGGGEGGEGGGEGAGQSDVLLECRAGRGGAGPARARWARQGKGPFTRALASRRDRWRLPAGRPQIARVAAIQIRTRVQTARLVRLAVQLDLVALHHLLDGRAHVAQPHVDARLAHALGGLGVGEGGVSIGTGGRVRACACRPAHKTTSERGKHTNGRATRAHARKKHAPCWSRRPGP